MNSLIKVTLIAMILTMGCASVKVEITGSQLKTPLCTSDTSPVSTVVYWGPQWRPNQKEPKLREAAALQGINDFLKGIRCITVLGVRRLTWESERPSNNNILKLTSESRLKPARVLLIVIRELGPHLKIGLPSIIEGGTEVKIDVEVLDTQTLMSLSSTQTRWTNGGTFVIKGTSSLSQDISSALSAVLFPKLVI